MYTRDMNGEFKTYGNGSLDTKNKKVYKYTNEEIINIIKEEFLGDNEKVIIDNWIKVEDKLPKMHYHEYIGRNASDEVLVLHRGVVYGGYYYMENEGFVKDGRDGEFFSDLDKITHWMELPKSLYDENKSTLS